MNYNVSINLLALNGVTLRRGQQGETLLCIDLRYPNGIKQTQKGIYLDLAVWENKNGVNQYGSTHYVKQSFSKEEKAALNGQQTPIIGNARPIEYPAQQPVGYAGGYYQQQQPAAGYQQPNYQQGYQQPAMQPVQPVMQQQFQQQPIQPVQQNVQPMQSQSPAPAPAPVQGFAPSAEEDDDDLPF